MITEIVDDDCTIGIPIVTPGDHAAQGTIKIADCGCAATLRST
jgi:hypothetical protein